MLPARGQVRLLKRLWLETSVLRERPPHLELGRRSRWAKQRVISRLDAGA